MDALRLFATLQKIFPRFGKGEEIFEEIEEARLMNTGIHCVMRHFTEYFGSDKNDISSRQLLTLGMLINDAVGLDSELENAISTCFLEHLRQIGSYKILSPYLSKKAKEKTRA